MHLNIKDPEAHRLARAIADATGETITHVVTEALRARHAEIEKKAGKATLEELREIVARFVALGPPDPIDHGDLLYDEFGLPK